MFVSHFLRPFGTEMNAVQYYYWELLDMTRKLLLTAVLVNFVNSESTAYVSVFAHMHAHVPPTRLLAHLLMRAHTCSHPLALQVAFVVSFAAFVLHTLCNPYTSLTLDHLQAASMLVICITQFSGIVIAARLDDSEQSTQQVIAVLITILNVLVIVLLPLQLLIRIPAALKACIHTHARAHV